MKFSARVKDYSGTKEYETVEDFVKTLKSFIDDASESDAIDFTIFDIKNGNVDESQKGKTIMSNDESTIDNDNNNKAKIVEMLTKHGRLIKRDLLFYTDIEQKELARLLDEMVNESIIKYNVSKHRYQVLNDEDEDEDKEIIYDGIDDTGIMTYKKGEKLILDCLSPLWMKSLQIQNSIGLAQRTLSTYLAKMRDNKLLDYRVVGGKYEYRSLKIEKMNYELGKELILSVLNKNVWKSRSNIRQHIDIAERTLAGYLSKMRLNGIIMYEEVSGGKFMYKLKS